MREHLKRQGVDPVGDTPEQFAQHFSAEVKKWGEVVKKAGIQAN
jgi:tripartite-type tricarboxylate transporter receptor subunit TctC